ncbi:MAG: hypothetical protein ACT4OK_15225 [Gemmobacter sp.]
MTDGIPQVALGIDDAAQSVVIVEGETEVGTLAALAAAAPGLRHPDAAATMARAVAHLAAGADYRVIEDPAAYEAAYRAQVAGEDPNAPWTDGVLRLRDHGMPDFTGIAAPAYHGTRLVFFAQNALIALPYRVEVDVGDAGATLSPDLFRAVSLVPFPPAGTTPAANPLFVGAQGSPDNTPDDPDANLASAPLVVEDVGDDDAPEEQ